MKIAAIAGVATLVQLLLFLCTGSVVMKLRGRKAWSVSGALLLGFFIYFSIFEIICLIAEVTLAPLGRLAVIMLVIDAAAIIAGTVYCGRDWIMRLKTLPERLKAHGILIFFAILAVLAVCFFALIYTDGSADADYYIGMASTALFTDSIGRYEPTNGLLMTAINPRYAYALYPYHNAVMSDLFHIPVIVQARTVMNVINAFMCCIAVYRLGICLFAGKAENCVMPETGLDAASASAVRKADLFTLLVLVMHLFSSTIYMPGTFLFSRSFEGKNLIANLVLPSVIAAAVSIWRGTAGSRRHLFADLFLMIAAGVCFSSSVVIPAAFLTAAIIPYILIRKDFRMIFGYLFSMVPAVVWMTLYVLNSHYVFIIRTYR